MLNKESNNHHHHHQNQTHPQNQMPFGLLQYHPSSSSSPSFTLRKDCDLGELDEAVLQYLDAQNQSSPDQQLQRRQLSPHTLNIFPSKPMHVEPSPTPSKGNHGVISSNKRSSSSMEPPSNPSNGGHPENTKAVKREGNSKGPTAISEQQGPKTPDPKTLRRLAQNREAARKSRLRKKAYVQQLESSRIRLTQLEQDIQIARSQGFFLGGTAHFLGDHALPIASINSDAAVFDVEYGRWLEEHHRLTVVLRNAVQEELPETELRMYVESCLAHYTQLMTLKNMAAKSDVFHILSGMWKTPAERCFMWMGGFRPSDLIKIMVRQIEGLTEEQVVRMYGLQQSTHEAEETLNQGMETVYQSISQTLISDSLTLLVPTDITTYMTHMSAAINKLSSLNSFLTQANNLRQQTLQQLHETLTTHQSAQCFLATAEYFHRLRALSGLWLARSRHQ